MKSAIIVYDGVNFLSFARIYDVFMRCGIDFVVIGFRGDARDEMGLALPMHLSSEPHKEHTVRILFFEHLDLLHCRGELFFRCHSVILLVFER